MNQLEQYALRIMEEIGLPSQIHPTIVRNQAETVEVERFGTKIRSQVTMYQDKTIHVEVLLTLPEEAVLADTFMDEVAKIEKLTKNHHYKYAIGPRYRDYSSEMFNKQTCALSPWSNHYLILESRYYPAGESEEAIANAITLAKKVIPHLDILVKLRYWKQEDKEVIAKAKEIVAGADLHETDVDREEKAHWLVDRNSFIRGWFIPFNDKGKGSFDIYWPASVDYAAKTMGRPGTFEYAVACLVLVDPVYIAKARKACRIRKENIEISY